MNKKTKDNNIIVEVVGIVNTYHYDPKDPGNYHDTFNFY